MRTGLSILLGSCFLIVLSVQAQTTNPQRENVAQFEELLWIPGASGANVDPDYLTPAVISDPQQPYYRQITDRLTSRSTKDTAKRVVFGFNSNGGGYLWSAVLQNFPGLPTSFEAGTPGYGKGMLGAIRDQMHRNRYNPEQAGRNDFQGVKTRVSVFQDAIHIPQFGVPLYSDGSASGNPRFPFNSQRSEFDFSSLTKDESSFFDIPSVSHKEYWAYAREPDAIEEFNISSNIEETDRVGDVSPNPALNFQATNQDMSFLVQTIRGMRPSTKFPYMHYRKNGNWALKTFTDPSETLNCKYELNNGNVFHAANRALNPKPFAYNVAGDCVLDLPFVVFSNSPSPGQGVGMALYVPGNDSWNKYQTKAIDRTKGVLINSEDRRFAFIFAIAKETEAHVGSENVRFVAARAFLSGLLSPPSSRQMYKKNAIEVLTNKSFMLYGTPSEILTAVLKYERAPQDCYERGVRIAHGESRMFYNKDIKEPGSSIGSLVRTCQLGFLSGSSEYRYPNYFEIDPQTNYDIYVIAGQSNAVGMGEGIQFESSSHLLNSYKIHQMGKAEFANLSAVTPARDSLNHWGTRSDSYKGFGIPFARRVANHLARNRKILLIPAARGSTSIVEWNNSANDLMVSRADSTELYDNMVSRVHRALQLNSGNRLKGVLWQQGGADILALANSGHPARLRNVSDSVYPAEYRKRLMDLRNDLRSEFSSQNCFAFLMGEEVTDFGDANKNSARKLIMDELQSVASSDPCGKSAVISSAALRTNEDSGLKSLAGKIHISAEGQRVFGHRFYIALKILMGWP